jgi:hypothetical protein
MKKQLLSVGAVCATLPLVLLSTSPADAATRWTYRSSTLDVAASFTIVGDPVDGFRSFQTGNVNASSQGDVSGFVESWSCPDGEYPPYYGDGGEPPYEEPATNCVDEGAHEFYGENADVSIAKKLTSATVSGPVEIITWSGGEGTSEPGTVDLVFTGAGGTSTSTEYSKGDGYVYKYETTQRSATVAGSAAGLSLDGAENWASISTTRSYERYASK